MTIYYLHIAGTEKYDCKWLFDSIYDLKKFLENLPLRKISISVKEHIDDEDGKKMGLQPRFETLENEIAVNYWEKHITINKIEKERFPKYHALFKARYWDESCKRKATKTSWNDEDVLCPIS